jgi:hypothetical protein
LVTCKNMHFKHSKHSPKKKKMLIFFKNLQKKPFVAQNFHIWLKFHTKVVWIYDCDQVLNFEVACIIVVNLFHISLFFHWFFDWSQLCIWNEKVSPFLLCWVKPLKEGIKLKPKNIVLHQILFESPQSPTFFLFKTLLNFLICWWTCHKIVTNIKTFYLKLKD